MQQPTVPGSVASQGLDGDADSAQLQGSEGSTRDASGSTLYFGNLHPCVTVPALQDICQYFGPVEQVKIIKDKGTGMGAGYGFVRFVDRRCANIALQYLNNKVLFGQEMRVNWAFQSHQREDTSTHWHIFVGDLGQDVSDAVLFASFSQLPGCSDARVMWDHSTGRSKGYGFVAMRSKEEAQAAIDRMHGQVIGSRRVRCGWAQHKQDESAAPPDPSEVDQLDPGNTNVYIGNIAPDWTEPDINAHFAAFGPIVEVKLHKKGGYGFVRYREHRDAVRAIVESNSKVVHGRPIKCSWGKSTTNHRQVNGTATIPGFGAATVGFNAAPGGGPGVPAGMYGISAGPLGGVAGGIPPGATVLLPSAQMGGPPMVGQPGIAQMVGPGVIGGAMGLGDAASLGAAGYMAAPSQIIAAAPQGGGAPGGLGQPAGVVFLGSQGPGAADGRLGGGMQAAGYMPVDQPAVYYQAPPAAGIYYGAA